MASLIARLFRPVDIASLVFFRVCFGVIMAWEAHHYLYQGWVGGFWVVPKFNFTFVAFDWVRPWPGDGMYLHFVALGILALCIASGCFYRLAAALFFPGFAYVLLLDKAYYLNHFYLLTIISFLLILVPANRAFSIDAWRNPKIRSDTTPTWTVWALALQVAIPYFYGGVAKLKTDWLILGEPMRAFLRDAAEAPRFPEILASEAAVYLLAWGGALFDLSIPFLLLWPRTRAVAFVTALGFHLTNAFLFNIGVFPWFMICATTLFFAPNWPRRFGFPPAPAGGKVSVGSHTSISPTWTQRAAVSLLALHFVIQLLVPFHHYLYPGDVNWTQEGSYFAWRMRLNAVSGVGALIATDPSTGESRTVDASQHLNPQQIKRMFNDPDMILQYAQFLAREAAANGRGEIEVRAKVRCSLNLRQPRVIIDPDVNLAAYERSIWPASFIVPFDEAPLALEGMTQESSLHGEE